MGSQQENNLESTNKKIMKTKRIGYLGTILLGLGLYAIFVAEGNAFHPALNNPNIGYGLIICGALISTWEIAKLIPLWKLKNSNK